ARPRRAHQDRGRSQPVQNEQDEADEAADDSAIDADILEVASYRRLQPRGDRARVPAADRLRHQLDDRTAIARRHADDRAAGEFIDRGADARVLLERAAHRLQHLADLAREYGIGVAGGLDDRLAALLPKRVEPQADRAVVEKLVLDRFDPFARLGTRLQVVGELGQRLLDLDSNR